MDTPTPDELRARSEYLKARYVDDDGGPRDIALTALAEDAAALVSSLTCRAIGPDAVGDDVPAGKVGLAIRAVAYKAEQLDNLGLSMKVRRRTMNSARLRGFTAGPYSESYFGPEESLKAHALDPDPAVHEALWALATQACKDAWMALWTGVQPPAAAVQTFAWAGRRGSRPRPLRF